MAIRSIQHVKSLFQTGDRPSEQDYIDLIDTLASKATDLGTAGNNESVVSGIENPTVIDSFSATEWRMVKYIISLSKTTAGHNLFYATEITLLVDGEDVSVTEYGTIDNDGDMGTIIVSREGDTVNLTVEPNINTRPVTVRFARMGLKA